MVVLLGHTTRNVSLLHESQREIGLIEALSRPTPDYLHGKVGEEKKRTLVSQGLCFLAGVDKKVGFQKCDFGGCSLRTKTGTRAHSPKPPFYYYKQPFVSQ